MLDSLAERYHKLPSEVLATADTLDLWVYDVSMSYRVLKESERADGKQTEHFNQGELLERLKKARKR